MELRQKGTDFDSTTHQQRIRNTQSSEELRLDQLNDNMMVGFSAAHLQYSLVLRQDLPQECR
jgi:hypothetical protein